MIEEKSKKEYRKLRLELALVMVLTGVYILAEIIGSIFTNSLALLADAGHMMGDFTALGLSFFATWIVTKPASSNKTYGYYRTEILVALINGAILAGVSAFIVYEGIMRLFEPLKVQAPLMIAIATGGLIINIIGAAVLHASAKKNLNIKGAFYHILGDLLGSIGTIIAGAIIYFFEFNLADLIISFIIAALVLTGAIKLIIESTNILLEGTPEHLDVNEIKEAISNLPNVEKVHELHVWSISSQRVALSVHVVSDYENNNQVLKCVDDTLRNKFNIDHLTIQVEPSDFSEKKCDF